MFKFIERVSRECLAAFWDEQDFQVWYAEAIAAETPVWQRGFGVVSSVVQLA